MSETLLGALIIVSIFCILNLYLFIKLLKKHDDLELKFYEYLEEVGTERLKMIDNIKHIDHTVKQLKLRYEAEIKKHKRNN
jgi:hypothetical protein